MRVVSSSRSIQESVWAFKNDASKKNSMHSHERWKVWFELPELVVKGSLVTVVVVFVFVVEGVVTVIVEGVVRVVVDVVVVAGWLQSYWNWPMQGSRYVELLHCRVGNMVSQTPVTEKP